jgi:hypothetical protein
LCWLLVYISKSQSSDVNRILNEVIPLIGKRPLAIYSFNNKDISWVRASRQDWANNGPWDKRAILWASQCLPYDERKHWLGRSRSVGDLLDQAIISYLMSQK